MFEKPNAEKRPGFLKRLRKDQSGNTVALMAAGLIPLTGMIGSGIDISRVYLVKTRLQQACDAGALAARKRMGSDVWSTESNTVAENMFDANFSAGTSGSVALTKSYSEAGGIVSGEASVDVPMVVMDMFGKEKSSIEVQCQAQLAVPNTDVMFVLDTTGSMNCADTALPGACGNNGNVEVTSSKIVGLRRAVRCFYEALSKQDSVADCGSTPSGVTQTAQTRFGFVPYAVNVNVGKLLPNEYLTDSFTYQSRVPVLTPVWVYELGTTSTISGWLNNWSPTTVPTSPYNTRQSTSGWSDVTSGTVTTLQGGKPFRQTGATSTNCTGSTYNNLTGSSSLLTGLSVTTGTPNSPNLLTTSQSPPVHPATQQVRTYNQTRNDVVVQYRYVWENRSGNGCFLERRNHTTPWVRTQTGGTATTPITWTQITDTFTNWEYRPVAHDVSGLKNGGSSWNNSIQLPVNFTTQTLNVSGTNGVSVKRATNMTANWAGCVEERATVRETDFDPLPDANDLDVDLIPTSDTSTQWAPLLPAAVWGRYSGTDTNALVTASRTTSSNLFRNLNNFNDNSDGDSSNNYNDSCPAEARIPTQWASASAFDAYVTGVRASGSTYHDIGLIWGARLLSPTGMFAANNTNRQNIQRHLVFMTDGETSTAPQNYGAYGAEWWDRRRTPTGTAPDNTLLNAQVNGRFLAMCEYIKNEMRITLWVVAFGSGITTQAQANMDLCASPGRSLTATSNTALLNTFRGIADEISDLRLTN
jgi:Flp pilus assembly protein TadG